MKKRNKLFNRFRLLLPLLCLLLIFCTPVADKAIRLTAALALPKQAASLWLTEHEAAKPIPAETDTSTPDAPLFPSEDVLSVPPVSQQDVSVTPLAEKDRGGKIYAETLSFSEYKQILRIGNGLLKNETSLSSAEIKKLAEKRPLFNIEFNSSQPQVLIYHTHTTESYDLWNCGYFKKGASARSTEKTKNMVAVGEAICRQLQEAGIGFVHDTNLYDSPSFNGSYQRSAAAVTRYLKKYPSIRIVIDVHRDAAYAADGGWRKFIAKINGKNAAQLMIITGCEDGTMDNPKWDQNLRFAALLQSQLAGDYPGLTRPLYFCYRNYNQQLSTGSILVEFGTHGNHLSEAVYSGELFGKSLAKVCQTLRA